MTIDVDPSLASRTLVEPDVSKLPGARFVAGLAIFDDGIDLSGGCVRAPSDRFVPGIESVLFERATSLALRASALTPTELATTKSASDPSGLYTRMLEGRTAEKSIGIAHVLTFAGSDRDALLCTLVCTSPTDRGNTDCTETLASLRIVGPHASPPDPSLLARTLFLAADHPKPALASLAVVTALIIVWVLARRPRPRP